MKVRSSISFTVKPARKASKRHPKRSSVGRWRIIRISMGFVCRFTSVSIDRRAFLKPSSTVRPMAITSPVDFMAVVRVRSAVLNLSKGQRGTFTTT
jgi:hypothetical protein